MPNEIADKADEPIPPESWRMLAVLVVVYVLNFIDRQLITILAPDLKRDLGIGDADFGFLYGTAFGVFYSLFGIPLGKLADNWSRTRLLALGLSLWSLMTALSGLSRNFVQIAAARVGVGIGEASASPCAYSLISDAFPPKRRASAIGIYSAGLYLGGGISLFLGSSLANWWNAAHAAGEAPWALAGWQFAFLAVGLPGLLLAGVVAACKEPERGRFDARSENPTSLSANPWTGFLKDLMDIVPPFTFLGASLRGARALLVNAGAACLIAVLVWLIVMSIGDMAQWIAFGLGVYATFSWTCALKDRDPGAFEAILKSRPFIGATLGYAGIAFLAYAATAFSPLYAIETLGAKAAEAGLILGSLGALGGAAGVIFGGIFSDHLAVKRGAAGRMLVALIAAAFCLAGIAMMFSATSLWVFYLAVPVGWFCSSAVFGACSGVVVQAVPGRLRATATAAYLLGVNLIGLALGPYAAGKMSEALGGIGPGMLSLLLIGPVSLGLLAMGYAAMKRNGRSRVVPESKR